MKMMMFMDDDDDNKRNGNKNNKEVGAAKEEVLPRCSRRAGKDASVSTMRTSVGARRAPTVGSSTNKATRTV